MLEHIFSLGQVLLTMTVLGFVYVLIEPRIGRWWRGRQVRRQLQRELRLHQRRSWHNRLVQMQRKGYDLKPRARRDLDRFLW